MEFYGSYHDSATHSITTGAFHKTFQTPFQPTSSDVFIALMGMTGAGKSTFISHCTEEEVQISEPGALESCTQEVRVHKCNGFSPSANVYLVDTPGFDDTSRKDTDILKEIAGWLTETYQKRIKLRGILYLHRISDNRMGGCAHKNLVMFKRLCGPEGIKSVTFVTTHWEQVNYQEAELREQQLQRTKDFWGFFVERGAQVNRHYDNPDSALLIIQQFVPGFAERLPEEVNLAIQTEMVNSGKDLDQTVAGQELQGEMEKERERMQHEMRERDQIMREALAARDREMVDFLRMEQEKQREELSRRNKEMDDLKISMERMHEEKIRQLESRIQQQQHEHLQYQRSVSHREHENVAKIERLQIEHDSEKSRQESLMKSLKAEIGQLKSQQPACQHQYLTESQPNLPTGQLSASSLLPSTPGALPQLPAGQLSTSSLLPQQSVAQCNIPAAQLSANSVVPSPPGALPQLPAGQLSAAPVYQKPWRGWSKQAAVQYKHPTGHLPDSSLPLPLNGAWPQLPAQYNPPTGQLSPGGAQLHPTTAQYNPPIGQHNLPIGQHNFPAGQNHALAHQHPNQCGNCGGDLFPHLGPYHACPPPPPVPQLAHEISIASVLY